MIVTHPTLEDERFVVVVGGSRLSPAEAFALARRIRDAAKFASRENAEGARFAAAEAVHRGREVRASRAGAEQARLPRARSSAEIAQIIVHRLRFSASQSTETIEAISSRAGLSRDRVALALEGDRPEAVTSTEVWAISKALGLELGPLFAGIAA